jgi:amidohydrolase
MKKTLLSCCIALSLLTTGSAIASPKDTNLLLKDVEGKVIEWRRDFHQNPELGNREVRTAKIVAEHLTSLGLEVETHIAYTGVVGILKGGKPRPNRDAKGRHGRLASD